MMYDYTLTELRIMLQEIAGQWNGKDSGNLEYNAFLALDTLALLDKVQEAVTELENAD